MDPSTPATDSSSASPVDPGAPVWPSAPPVGPPAAGPAEESAAGWPAAPPAGGPPPGAEESAAGGWTPAPPGPAGAPPPAAAAPGDEWAFGAGDPPDGTELPPAGLWQKMRADPQYAPEHLALEAVSRLGPQARMWVEQTRARYPGIPAETVAQIAVRRFTTFARLSGAAAGATGLPGAVIDIGVLAWTQARMVLHVAAAYGMDPTDPERATDLLVLQNVHKVAQTARSALAVARGHEQAGTLFGKAASAPMSQVFVQLGLKLAQMAGVKAAKKIFAKIMPGAAIILGTWANSSATKDLAKRTVVLYQKAHAQPYQLPPA